MTSPHPWDSRATDERDPLIGVELGGFRVTRRLAEGGMGLVYEAMHEAIGRRAAVKVLKPEVATDAEWTRRFLTEARALGALKHRNLVEILNFGKTPDGREFLMMEFLDGQPLDVLLEEQGSLPIHTALSIADQVANGLSEAHKKGIVHRDLKPSNVHLLREHNGDILVKVLDFGLARQDPVALADDASVRVDQASLLAGTPEYIAPEQAQGRTAEPAANLYSLGVMLFEMLTGRRPFEGQDVNALLRQHLSAKPPSVGALVDHLPEGLDALVDSLLSKDPNERPPTADALRVELQRFLKLLSREQTAVRARPVPTEAPTKRIASVKTNPGPPPTRSPWPWVGLALALAVGAAVALRFGSSREEAAPPLTKEELPTLAAPTLPKVTEPVVEQPVQHDPPPDVVDPAPLAKLPPRPKAPEVDPAKPSCAPTEDWKNRLTLDIEEMGNTQRVIADADLYDVWDRKRAQLTKQIASASTSAQCTSAQQAYDKLRAQLGFH